MGCQPLTNCDQLANKIALMKRGGCMFAEKVKHAEFCGAIGAIIIDNQPNTRLVGSISTIPTGKFSLNFKL